MKQTIKNKVKILTSDKKNFISLLINYLKVFFFFFIPMALLITLTFFCRLLPLESFIEGLALTAFGVMCTILILMPIDILCKIIVYLKYQNIDFNLKPAIIILIEDDFEEVFKKLLYILNNFSKGSQITKNDIKFRLIGATVKKTWKSMGEIITIRFLNDSNGEVKINISSKSRNRLTLVDYSKNFENIMKILKKINLEFGG